MLFNNRDFDFSFFEIPGSDFQLEIERGKFVSPATGFLRGNMMRDEYVPYKNYNEVKLIPTSKREEVLWKIMELSFAITDLNLYLDGHPSDLESYELLQKYVDEKRALDQEYVTKYGPLKVTNTKTKQYEWTKSPWPWDYMGGNKYV